MIAYFLDLHKFQHICVSIENYYINSSRKRNQIGKLHSWFLNYKHTLNLVFKILLWTLHPKGFNLSHFSIISNEIIEMNEIFCSTLIITYLLSLVLTIHLVVILMCDKFDTLEDEVTKIKV